jgi:hypothetical protein
LECRRIAFDADSKSASFFLQNKPVSCCSRNAENIFAVWQIIQKRFRGTALPVVASRNSMQLRQANSADPHSLIQGA